MSDRIRGSLSKKIPARNMTVKFIWIRRHFTTMNANYRRVRPKSKPMDTCFWCKYDFVDGDSMALAAREKGNNVVLCDHCAVEAESK